MDYKNTLLLPKTDFPMRAEFAQARAGLSRQVARRIKSTTRFWKREKDNPRSFSTTAHPSPTATPTWAHALNMVLKDIVLKYQNMSGHYAPFVPGWDCTASPSSTR